MIALLILFVLGIITMAGASLQEGIKLGEEDMLRKVIAKLADYNSDMARLYLTGLRTSLSQMTIDLVKLEALLKEE